MRPWGREPARYMAARAASEPRASRSRSAMRAAFSVFRGVARTRSTTSTSVARGSDGGAVMVPCCHRRRPPGLDSGTPMFELIAFDADDTLWHNETLFQATARDFASLLSGCHPPEW